MIGEHLVDVYRSRYGCEAVPISNGVPRPRPPGRPLGAIGERLGISEQEYVMFLGRLVPEKAPDLLIDAFRRYPGPERLVIVGGSSFTDSFTSRLVQLAEADPRVVLAGYVYGEDKAVPV